MLWNETNSLLYLNLAFANPLQGAVRDRMLLHLFAASLPRLHSLSSRGIAQKMKGWAMGRVGSDIVNCFVAVGWLSSFFFKT